MTDVFEGIFHSNRALDGEMDDDEPDWLDLGTDTEEEVQTAYSKMLNTVQNNGLLESGREKLSSLLLEYRDVFRLRLGNDLPADVHPMEVVLLPGAQSVRAKSRPYSAEKHLFLRPIHPS